jgi:hypothetical protein
MERSIQRRVGQWTRDLETHAATRRGRPDFMAKATIKEGEMVAAMRFATRAQELYPTARTYVTTASDFPVAGDEVTVRVKASWMTPRQARWAGRMRAAAAGNGGRIPLGFTLPVSSAAEARDLANQYNYRPMTTGVPRSARDPLARVLKDPQSGQWAIHFGRNGIPRQSRRSYEWSSVPNLSAKLGEIRGFRGVQGVSTSQSTDYAPGGWRRVLTVYAANPARLDRAAIRARAESLIPGVVVEFARPFDGG